MAETFRHVQTTREVRTQEEIDAQRAALQQRQDQINQEIERLQRERAEGRLPVRSYKKQIGQLSNEQNAISESERLLKEKQRTVNRAETRGTTPQVEEQAARDVKARSRAEDRVQESRLKKVAVEAGITPEEFERLNPKARKALAKVAREGRLKKRVRESREVITVTGSPLVAPLAVSPGFAKKLEEAQEESAVATKAREVEGLTSRAIRNVTTTKKSVFADQTVTGELGGNITEEPIRTEPVATFKPGARYFLQTEKKTRRKQLEDISKTLSFKVATGDESAILPAFFSVTGAVFGTVFELGKEFIPTKEEPLKPLITAGEIIAAPALILADPVGAYKEARANPIKTTTELLLFREFGRVVTAPSTARIVKGATVDVPLTVLLGAGGGKAGKGFKFRRQPPRPQKKGRGGRDVVTQQVRIPSGKKLTILVEQSTGRILQESSKPPIRTVSVKRVKGGEIVTQEVATPKTRRSQAVKEPQPIVLKPSEAVVFEQSRVTKGFEPPKQPRAKPVDTSSSELVSQFARQQGKAKVPEVTPPIVKSRKVKSREAPDLPQGAQDLRPKRSIGKEGGREFFEFFDDTPPDVPKGFRPGQHEKIFGRLKVFKEERVAELAKATGKEGSALPQVETPIVTGFQGGVFVGGGLTAVAAVLTPDITEAPKPLTTQEVSLGANIQSDQATGTITDPSTRVDSVLSQEFKPITITEVRTDTAQAQAIEFSPAQVQESVLTPFVPSEQVPIPFGEPTPTIKPRPVERPQRPHRPLPPPRTPRRPKETPTPPPRKTPFLPPQDDDGKKRKREDEFTVFGRRRGLFSPLDTFKALEGAVERGEIFARQTAGASFKVVSKSRGLIDTLDLADRRIFRRSKREAGVIVQKREKRISSVGEKAEIRPKGFGKVKNIFR